MTARIALVLLALLVATGCSSAGRRGADAADGAFALRLVHKREETSKASNGQLTEIAIEGRRVTYAWPSSGFHPDSDFRRKVLKRARLSEAELDAIQETIRTRDLLRSVEEIKPVGALGISVDVDLKIEMEGQTATVRIQGMQRIRDGSATRTNLAHASTVTDVEALVSQVRSIVEGR